MRLPILLKLILACIATPLAAQSTVQNFALNPSFEETSDCPTGYNQINLAKNWIALSHTPDLFSTCATSGKVRVPENFFGNRKAAEGNNYIGLLAYHERSPRELVAVKLSTPLTPGHKYRVSFKTSWADIYSNYACNNLGILFVKDTADIHQSQTAHVLAEDIITQKDYWLTISQEIVADQLYQYLVLGNLLPKERLKLRKMRNSAYPAAYYFIDDIRVERVPDEAQTNNFVRIKGKVLDASTKMPIEARVDFVLSEVSFRAFERSKATTGEYVFSNMQRVSNFYLEAKARGYFSERVLVPGNDTATVFTQDFALVPTELGSTFILQDIVFETGKATLLPESFPELQLLASFLHDHPNYHVEINGHTDNVGDPTANFKLSEERAQSIVRYLIDKGSVPRSRLFARGFGDTQPIADNGKAEGRLMNRRVELKIIKD